MGPGLQTRWKDAISSGIEDPDVPIVDTGLLCRFQQWGHELGLAEYELGLRGLKMML